jgi:hypothetical protein
MCSSTRVQQRSSDRQRCRRCAQCPRATETGMLASELLAPETHTLEQNSHTHQHTQKHTHTLSPTRTHTSRSFNARAPLAPRTRCSCEWRAEFFCCPLSASAGRRADARILREVLGGSGRHAHANPASAIRIHRAGSSARVLTSGPEGCSRVLKQCEHGGLLGLRVTMTVTVRRSESDSESIA